MPIRNAWHRLNEPRAIRRVPEKAGVYELGNKYHTVIYIGRAGGGRLRDRIYEHVDDGANRHIRDNAVYFRFTTTRAFINEERELFEEYKKTHQGKIPPCNTQDPSD